MLLTIVDFIFCGMPETIIKQLLDALRHYGSTFFKRLGEYRMSIRNLAVIGIATSLALLLLQLPALAETSSASTPAAEASPTPIPFRSVNIPDDHKWHYSVTPYLFVPQINGTFQFRVRGLGAAHGPVTISPHEPPSSYVQHINALTMISGEARKDKAVAAFDYIWLNISTQKAGMTIAGPGGNATSISANAGFRVTANIWTVEAGSTIAHSNTATVDALIGVRSLNVRTALNWNLSAPIPILPQSGTIAKSGTANDIVAAVRGKVRLGNRLFIPYYFDGGYGSGSSTAQAVTGFAYEEPWGNVSLVYRALIYNANPASLNQRLTFNGLAIGASYKL